MQAENTGLARQQRAPGEAAPAWTRGGARRAAALCGGYAAALLVTGVAWDVAGTAASLPPWWPPVSYACVAIGIGAGCVAVLLRLLVEPRTRRRRGAALLDMLGLGLLLGAWLLRGHAEIPPDAPLVAGQLVALAPLLTAARLRSAVPETAS